MLIVCSFFPLLYKIKVPNEAIVYIPKLYSYYKTFSALNSQEQSNPQSTGAVKVTQQRETKRNFFKCSIL